MDLKLTVDGLEKERDFYFSKLRDIELICQEHENENSPIITGIVSVLYATEVRGGPSAHPWSSCPCPAFWISQGGEGLSSPCIALSLVHSVGCQEGVRLCQNPHAMPSGGWCAHLCHPCFHPGGLCPTRG